MNEYWLDLGSGLDAEHWSASAAPAGVRRVALDPLFTSGMVASGRLSPLPADILRVGAEVRPAGSLEPGREQSFLPFRSGVFSRVHCGFMLHLYLETLELLTAETHRVLRPGGILEILVPHLGDSRSDQVLRYTTLTLGHCYAPVETERYAGPFDTFWADLYQDRTFRIRCWRA